MDSYCSHHCFRTLVRQICIRPHAEQVNRVLIVPEHVIVPLVFHIPNYLINAPLTQVLFNEGTICQLRVLVGDLSSWWREAEPAFADAVLFNDLWGAHRTFERDDSRDKDGVLP